MNICTCHLLITRPAKHRLSFPLRLPESLITIELSTSLLLSSSSKICASTRIDFRGGGRALSNISPGMHLPPPVHEQAVSPSRFCHSSTGLKMSLIKRAGSGERNTCARVSHPHSESRVGNALWRGMNTPERRERERERRAGRVPGPFYAIHLVPRHRFIRGRKNTVVARPRNQSRSSRSFSDGRFIPREIRLLIRSFVSSAIGEGF